MNPDYECIEEVMAVAAPMHPDYESTEVIATTAAAMYPDYHSSEEDVRHRGPGFAHRCDAARVCVCVCVRPTALSALRYTRDWAARIKQQKDRETREHTHG